VLFVFDAASDDIRQDVALLEEVRLLNPHAPLLVVGNKIDLVEQSWIARPKLNLSQPGSRNLQSAIPRVLPVSAKTGQGLDHLRGELAELLSKAAAPRAEGLLLHDRQRQGISQAAQSAAQAAALLAASAAVSDVAELAAVELRTCLDSLGGITGRVFSEDILASIFARFCIGK
jgi:tRNA modification GTPase